MNKLWNIQEDLLTFIFDKIYGKYGFLLYTVQTKVFLYTIKFVVKKH